MTMTSNSIFKVGLMTVALMLLISCEAQGPIIDMEMATGFDVESGSQMVTSKADCFGRGLEMVRLAGKVRYFGYDILQSPPAPRPLVGIPDVQVWLAEYPASKNLNIVTDEDGLWEMYIIKRRGQTVSLSMMYEKDHYPAAVEGMVFPGGLPEGWDKSVIKSNVYTVASEDVDDFAMQMPDELFLFYAKSSLEGGLSQVIGVPYGIENIVVATVGKSWASIYDPALPHGDEGAIVTVSPALPSPLSGPIYFDETVTPNPMVHATSVDGGVLFNNLLPGTVRMSAQKDPFSYDIVQFNIESAVRLYIASPPHSIQGNNPSGPGEL